MIHPTAVIDSGAVIADGAEIGPYAVIGENVRIGEGTVIGPHAVIRGPTTIGRENRIFQFASIGEAPQDLKYAGEETRLEIGDRNRIREYVTIHRGTVQDNGITRIGNDNLLMVSTHVAHDCVIGNHVIMSNAASLAGHVHVQDNAILGGFTLVHQYCTVGAHCFTGMGSGISKDVPPYVLVSGNPAVPHGINSEGLKRRDFSEDDIRSIKKAYKLLYTSGLKLSEASEQIEVLAESHPAVMVMAEFLQKSRRSIVR